MGSRDRGILLSYGKIIVNMVCGLLLSVVLLRLLGDTEYGIYQTVSAFAGYLVLLEFGMGTVMVRNLSACRGENANPAALQRQVGTIWSMTGVCCLLIGATAVVFYCLMPLLYTHSMTMAQIVHGQEIFLLITGHVVLSFLAQTAGGVLLAMEYYSFSAGGNRSDSCPRGCFAGGVVYSSRCTVCGGGRFSAERNQFTGDNGILSTESRPSALFWKN